MYVRTDEKSSKDNIKFYDEEEASIEINEGI